jgi:hypothetical protein
MRIIYFLDCKIDETCIPGTGSTSIEELAEMQPDEECVRLALYSGYLKHNGLKVLMVVCPNRVIAFFYGPVSA